MSKKRDRRRTARASTGLTQRKTGPPSLGGELPEKVTGASEDLAKFQQTFATTDRDLALVLGLQAAASAGYPRTDNELTHRSTRAAVNSLGARDGLEVLLVVQMVSTHNLAMTLLACAAMEGQTTEGVELFTNSANRLLRTFAAQVEALKTYRSKGEQKVAVEHVHIHRGGQAIVGAVNQTNNRGGGGDDKKGQQ
jgi:hypothetical protein